MENFAAMGAASFSAIAERTDAISGGLTTVFQGLWRILMGEKLEVQWLQIGEGKHIPAYKAICPQCNKLDLNTQFDTSHIPWNAICGRGHQFMIDPTANA